MAWVTPKTDWTAANGVADTDMNRIEENTRVLKEESIRRFATIVVAASNSSDAGKASADYVCDGVDDEVQIQAALDALTTVIDHTFTAAAGAAQSLTFPASAEAVEYFYLGYTVNIISGAGAGQSKTISSYSGSTKLAGTSSGNFSPIPNSTSVFTLTKVIGKVLLLEGDYVISNTINPPSGSTLEGQGNGTKIKLKNGLSNINAVHCQIKREVTISSLVVDGNKAATSGSVYSLVQLNSSSLCRIIDCTVLNGYNSIDGGNIYTSGHGNIIRGCYSLASKGHGISSNGAHEIVEGNILEGNLNGIQLSSSAKHCKVSGNQCVNNTRVGIASDGNGHVITDNICRLNGRHGIQLSGDSCIVAGNLVWENSTSANLTYDNIHLETARYNSVQGNSCHKGGILANRPGYGINVFGASCTSNLVTNNDLREGGETGAYVNTGTTTSTTAGNRLA